MRLLLLFFICSGSIVGQPYLAEHGKTRHRFAQSVFGMDIQGAHGGNSQLLDESGNLQPFSLPNYFMPRAYISGTHFWGHAEFFFTIPLLQLSGSRPEVRTRFSQSDIFGLKIYPWPIRKNRLRPFAGTALSQIAYRQSQPGASGAGPRRIMLRAPLSGGFNYCSGKYLFEASVVWLYDNSFEYYISKGQQARVNTAPFLFNIGVRKWLETTLSAEKSWQDGSAQNLRKKWQEEKKLSSWFIGIGPSSAFYTKNSPYNNERFPFMHKPYMAVFPEVSAGYFYEPLDLHIGSAFRYSRTRINAYGHRQQFKRGSMGVEAFKYLFDYHGFNPYLGACATYERLSFSHSAPDMAESFSKQQLSAGILFGWDILPNHLEAIVLRTNLRYFPNLFLKDQKGLKIVFDQLEFNFIQLIVYPQRFKMQGS